MIKVLIIYSISGQVDLIRSTCRALKREGIKVDAIDITTGLFIDNKQSNVYLSIFRFFCKFFRIGRVLATPFLLQGLSKILKDYTILDVHGVFARSTFSVIRKAKGLGKKVKVILWGSDFYRASAEKQERMKKIFKEVDAIQVATNKMASDFLNKYPFLQDKVKTLLYGTEQMDLLQDMIEGKLEAAETMISPKAKGKLIICLGYNATVAQRHEQMLDAINTFSEEIKNKIFILLPLTYGGSQEYINKIKNKADQIGVEYQIYTDLLPIKEMLTVRLKTNVVVNIQDSDAFAASIREHIMARNLLVVGDWLPYNLLEENNIFVKKTSKASLSEDILWAIENFEKEDIKNKLQNNQEKIYYLTSWKTLAKQWVNVYRKINEKN